MGSRELCIEALNAGIEPPSFKDLLLPVSNPAANAKKRNKKKKRQKAKKQAEVSAAPSGISEDEGLSKIEQLSMHPSLDKLMAEKDKEYMEYRRNMESNFTASPNGSSHYYPSLDDMNAISSTDWQFTLESNAAAEPSDECIISSSHIVDEAEFPIHFPTLEEAASPSNISSNSVHNNLSPFPPIEPIMPLPTTTSSKKKKKKKKKSKNANPAMNEPIDPQTDVQEECDGNADEHAFPSFPNTNNGKPKDKIWAASNTEEREQIREFWLSLSESERRSLVKVEKEAVLQKMKEQQKYSCSCSVCGRKRLAIEEELEVLYDAYYEELEQYANIQRNRALMQQSKALDEINTPIASAPNVEITEYIDEEEIEKDIDFQTESETPEESLGEYVSHQDDTSVQDGQGLSVDKNISAFTEQLDSVDVDANQVESLPYTPTDPSRLHEKNSYHADLYNFGSSLTVKGGILTVADDLLKNDGKKFIEMMEQLAERRMQREDNNTFHEPEMYDSGIEYDENEDEEDEDIDEEDEDELDLMTDEQRMEEGRRMFQIFAARLFEQRVLQAYREKVAQQRQAKLLEEIEEENRRKKERELRKLKEKERKRDKKKQQRLAKEEERQKREAERLAEEAAQKAAEAKKAEEARKRKEEQRIKKEEKKRQQELERQKKEEKRRMELEERQRQKELEKKLKKQQEEERLNVVREQQLRLQKLEEKKLRQKELEEEEKRRSEEEQERSSIAQAQEADEAERKLREAKIAAFFAPSKEDTMNIATHSSSLPQALPNTYLRTEPQFSPSRASSVAPNLPSIRPREINTLPFGTPQPIPTYKNPSQLPERLAPSPSFITSPSFPSPLNIPNSSLCLDNNGRSRQLSSGNPNLLNSNRNSNGLYSPVSLLTNHSSFGLGSSTRNSLGQTASPVHYSRFSNCISPLSIKPSTTKTPPLLSRLNLQSNSQQDPSELNDIIGNSVPNMNMATSKETLMGSFGTEALGLGSPTPMRSRPAPIRRPSQGSSLLMKKTLKEERLGSRALLDENSDTVLSQNTSLGASYDGLNRRASHGYAKSLNYSNWNSPNNTAFYNPLSTGPWSSALGAFTPSTLTSDASRRQQSDHVSLAQGK
ncbi:fungal protein [Schizosaccharomyces cryophilus OY26]|uniref:Stress response protein NST1 n=1 Tax=Schizosaccharomyces cryophilus (strain OY26 / ATCC MYA-4695 / CBS 11777 / NBRC 106824 / NRRL Y48691) TaxID=653667 RepID=S9X4D5_SCHCR|nr:uncharacterized protein SPOG_00349 [Schizosaccharomyces cryophilus OY26]EPY51927.1 fungal protein [Schizosaccharomyces cryophilus OY26]